MRISVIGLGYVGAVTAACFARDGHDVLGIDLDQTKLNLLQEGKSPIVEDEIDEITKVAANSGKLSVDTDVDISVVGSDIVFVCVGTPSAVNGSQDLTAIKRVSEQLGTALAEIDSQPTIVIRSTVPPGTTLGMIQPVLEQTSGKVEGKDFGLCFQPEFLREGTSVKDFYNPPFTIVGGEGLCIDRLEQLFGEFPGEFVATNVAAAEMLKLACNTFHALKISFANEIGRLANTLEVDPREVMDLVCRDTQLNISRAYLRPGFAFGGSCLPKDLRALLYLAKSGDVELPMLQGILPSNREHIDRVVNMVTSGESRRVGLIGLSFKQGTDDLRESPLVSLAELLIGKGYDLKIYDPAVSLALLVGSNKSYIERTIPHIGNLLSSDLNQVCAHADTLVVGHSGDEIDQALRNHGGHLECVVDLVGIDPQSLGHARYLGACW